MSPLTNFSYYLKFAGISWHLLAFSACDAVCGDAPEINAAEDPITHFIDPVIINSKLLQIINEI